jgi:hypothetical protein
MKAPKKPITTEQKKKNRENAKKLFAKLLRHSTFEIKKLKIDWTPVVIEAWVKEVVLPVFRAFKPSDAKVKDIRELVRDTLETPKPIGEEWFNPLLIPIGDITGIMWADIDTYLDVNLRAVTDSRPLRIDVNAGEYGASGIFNLQEYQYEATQLNEIYDGIRTLVENDSDAEWNGKVVVRPNHLDDGNANSYILQFTLYVDDEEIPPTAILDESVGIEIPKETKEQRKTRLLAVIKRKRELALVRRKNIREKGMRSRKRPKEKEAPATEIKSDVQVRADTITTLKEQLDKDLAEAKELYKDGVTTKEEYNAERKQIRELYASMVTKLKRGGEI